MAAMTMAASAGCGIEKEQADQNGERGGKRVEVCSALSCDRAHGYRRDQAGRGVGSDDELARRAEHRVGEQCGDDGIETHDRRHADDIGIGHAFGHHHRPKRDPRQKIGRQAVASIGRQPIEDRQQSVSRRGEASRDIRHGPIGGAGSQKAVRASNAGIRWQIKFDSTLAVLRSREPGASDLASAQGRLRARILS
jgi:hypothetical protein